MPSDRLNSILSLIAETSKADDHYLNELLTEEAKRTATVKRIAEEAPVSTEAVKEEIAHTAKSMGVGGEWALAQDSLGEDVSATQDELIDKAVGRYKHPRLLEGPQEPEDSDA